MSLAVLAAAVPGLIAGAYARAVAAQFAARPGGEPDDRGEDRDDREGRGEDREDRGEDRGEGREDHRKEALRAFAAAARVVPLPRPPYVVEAATALTAALVVWRVHDGWVVAAWLYAVVAGAALAEIDRRTWRLPDAITLPSYPILLALLAPSGRLLPALAAGCALGAVYAVLWFARPTGLGLGDVKLAGLIGLLTGALGAQATVVAGMAGQILGALYALGLLLARRATRTTEFPFGPFMLAGALVAVAFPGT
ncbi:A24 family peptidase [Microbispora sp. NPDC088329]|uniref:A24 family peptidase n=1 Tax=Microbispora sp. NPDC088329 TaxID=3154869 RepID=UPI00341BAA8A